MSKAAAFESFRAAELAQLEAYFAKSMQERSSGLQEMILYHYATGGKRLRAMGALWAAKGAAEVKGADSAGAVEMVHNATLIHDDLQDGDELRRGKPTLWKKYSPAQAINCGDLLFFEATRVITGAAEYDDSLARILLRLLEEKTIAVVEGQGSEFVLKEQLAKQGRMPTTGEYEAMVAGKTSALFSLPLVGGARIAGASDSQTAELEKGAGLLGFAFQIHDDYIDLWGEKGRAAAGSDIAEGKLSFPAIRGQARMEVGEAQRFASILATPRERTSPADIAWAIAALERAGTQDECRERLWTLRRELEAIVLWQDTLLPLFDSFASA